jgi:predicted SAM-dependent methyltransferase
MPHHKKFNVGCGLDKREGYTNVDINGFHDPDLIADITDIHQVEDGFAEEVLAQDVLEHVPTTKLMPALVEWNRVLCMDGTLRVRVPDLKSIASMLLAGAPQADVVSMLYGTQSYAGDFHMAGFTVEILTDRLNEAGFKLSSLDILDGWLISAVARKVRNVRSQAFGFAKDANSSNTEYVRSIFITLLGREPDVGGLQHFVQSLDEGVRDRYQVITTIASSDEARQKAVRLVS